METPEYTSSCAITQKKKKYKKNPANARVVKISRSTPIPDIQLGSITFRVWPHAYSHRPLQETTHWHLGLLKLCPCSASAVYWRYVRFTAPWTKLLMQALVFYLFAMPFLYQAFNYLIILHWAQLKHNWLVLLQKSTSSAAARQLTKQRER